MTKPSFATKSGAYPNTGKLLGPITALMPTNNQLPAGLSFCQQDWLKGHTKQGPSQICCEREDVALRQFGLWQEERQH